MSMHGRSQRSVAAWMGIVFAVLSIVWVAEAWGQASYTAQIRGVVKDQSGALVPNATITITNDATGISETSRSDDHGLYVLTGLRLRRQRSTQRHRPNYARWQSHQRDGAGRVRQLQRLLPAFGRDRPGI